MAIVASITPDFIEPLIFADTYIPVSITVDSSGRYSSEMSKGLASIIPTISSFFIEPLTFADNR
jgi:hypothetical protein